MDPTEIEVPPDTLDTPLPKLVCEIVPVEPIVWVELQGVGEGVMDCPTEEEMPPETVEVEEMLEISSDPVPVGSNIDVEL